MSTGIDPALRLAHISADDVDTLARTIYGEARGELWQGKVAVAWVIRNRFATGYRGSSIAGVCRAPWQFSCWLESDPNRARLLAASEEQPIFRECKLAALAVVCGLEPDPTSGSRHYHADYVSPNWADGHIPVGRIGRHVFYNDVP